MHPVLARNLLSDLADLLLPRQCGGCGADGASLCDRCLSWFAGPVRLSMPDPSPPGLPPVWAAAPYRGSPRSAVVALKERGRHDLAGVLGDVLAGVILVAAGGVSGSAAPAIVVVPVPTAPTAVRARGGCHVTRVATRAVDSLRRADVRAVLGPALTVVRSRPDSSRLNAVQRVRSIAGSLEQRPGALARGFEALAPYGSTASVVVVDDVVTTGATLREASGQLRLAAGNVSCAVLTATLRED